MNRLIQILLLSLFAISCTVNQEFENIKPIHQTDLKNTQIPHETSKLSQSDAATVAINFMQKNIQAKAKHYNSWTVKTTNEVNVILDPMDNPVAYIINFNEDGFCIVSATKEDIPILAYSEFGTLTLDDTINDSGLSLWIEELITKSLNKEERTLDEELALKRAWLPYEDYSSINSISTRSNDPALISAFNQQMSKYSAESGKRGVPLSSAGSLLPPNIYSSLVSAAGSMNHNFIIVEIIDNPIKTEVGPFLKTSWNQWYPFNTEIPDPNCPAGCVPIAMAQVMMFHQFPTKYDWNSMNNIYHTNLASLIAEIGQITEVKYSYTSSPTTLPKTIKGFHHYQYTVNEKEYTTSDVINEITKNKKPVFMIGSQIKTETGYKDGHAWVCDGIVTKKEKQTYRLDIPYKRNGQYIYSLDSRIYSHEGKMSILEHMNWGWGANNGNGWFQGGSSLAPGQDAPFQFYRRNLYLTPLK